MNRPSICFLGLYNLPALADEFRHLTFGGAELQQVLLARALAQRGFAASMVVLDHGQADDTTWHGVRTFKAYGLDQGLPGVRFFHPRWSGTLAALRRAGARVIYSSGASYMPGMAAHYARRHGGKTVFRISSISDCQPDNLIVPNRRGKFIYEFGLRRQDLLLAQNEAQRSEMRRNYGRDSVVVPSLVEPADRSVPLAERRGDLLWVSNIRDCKRPDRVLELMPLLPEAKLDIMGGRQPYELGYFDEIQQRCAAQANIRFHGPMPYSDVNAAMAQARLLLNTSDIEGFPNTFLQAWVRGTPVVTFFDPAGVVAREGLGTVVSSINEMRDAIRRFRSDDTAWAECSARCLRYVNAEHGGGAVDRFEAELLKVQPCAA